MSFTSTDSFATLSAVFISPEIFVGSMTAKRRCTPGFALQGIEMVAELAGAKLRIRSARRRPCSAGGPSKKRTGILDAAAGPRLSALAMRFVALPEREIVRSGSRRDSKLTKSKRVTVGFAGIFAAASTRNVPLFAGVKVAM